MLKLPSIQESQRQQQVDNHNAHQPAEFTLAKFGNGEAEAAPKVFDKAAGSTGGWKTVQMSMQSVRATRLESHSSAIL